MPSLKQIEVEGGDLPTGTIGNVASGGGGEAKASKHGLKCDDDDDVVDVMGVTTLDQQLARRKESAEKNGDMLKLRLNLCNDSDTEDTKSSAVKVKTEQTGSAERFAAEAPPKSNESMEVDSTVKVKTEQTQTESKKKKRKQSILEMMNPDYVGKSDEKDVDSEKENNSKKDKAAKSSSTKSSKKKKKPKSGADIRIRSFYSLSPKEEGSKSPMAGEGSAKTPITSNLLVFLMVYIQLDRCKIFDGHRYVYARNDNVTCVLADEWYTLHILMLLYSSRV